MAKLSTERKPRHARKSKKWYADGLRFTCKKCRICCSGEPGYIWVTENEIVKISAYLGMSLRAFTDEYTRPAGPGYSLKELPGGDCVFLGKSGCNIYKVRPVQCSTWPFWKRNLRSREAWEECCIACQGSGQGRRHTFSEIERSILKSDH